MTRPKEKWERETCPNCNGSGQIRVGEHKDTGNPRWTTCPTCGGNGYIWKSRSE